MFGQVEEMSEFDMSLFSPWSARHTPLSSPSSCVVDANSTLIPFTVSLSKLNFILIGLEQKLYFSFNTIVCS